MPTDTTAEAPYFNHDETMAYCVQQAASAMDDIAAVIAKVIIESMGIDPHPLLTHYLATHHQSDDCPTKKPDVTPAGCLG